jgi:hypothetical protein
MRTFASGLALVVAAFVFWATPAAAEFFGCNTPKTTVRNYGGSNQYASVRTTHEFAAQSSRPRFTISPRQNRTRYY